MDYQDLKKQSLQILKRQTIIEDYESISQEDITLLKKIKYDMVKYPVYGLGWALALITSFKFLQMPSFIRNPLQPTQAVEVRYKSLGRFMRPQVAFVFFCFGLTVGTIRYELTKYYLYVKYQKPVNRYLDVCDKIYLQELQRLSMSAEKIVTDKVIQ